MKWELARDLQAEGLNLRWARTEEGDGLLPVRLVALSPSTPSQRASAINGIRGWRPWIIRRRGWVVSGWSRRISWWARVVRGWIWCISRRARFVSGRSWRISWRDRLISGWSWCISWRYWIISRSWCRACWCRTIVGHRIAIFPLGVSVRGPAPDTRVTVRIPAVVVVAQAGIGVAIRFVVVRVRLIGCPRLAGPAASGLGLASSIVSLE